MSLYDTALAQCPYYIENFNPRQARNHQIRCEGVETNNKINLVFPTKKDKLYYMERYCFSVRRCHLCRIHKMLDEKYKEEDDE